MPCEACNTQFTVFKRKKSCTECRRLYCSNCLIKNKDRILCKRCIIFTTRPLTKIELLKLKAKDLIFYLQSKHISTTGCVEKEELVNLVLIHIDNPNNCSPESHSSQTFTMGTEHTDDTRSNAFDQIRSTCQNLFTTFTEKISTDFNFEFKSNPGNEQPASNVCNNQPRYSDSFRGINPFNGNGGAPNPVSNANRNHQRPTTMTSTLHRPSGSGSPDLDDYVLTSPVIGTGTRSNSDSRTSSPSCFQSSNCSMADDPHNPTTSHGTESKVCIPGLSNVKTKAHKKKACARINAIAIDRSKCCNEGASGCECSDDDLITRFREEYSASAQDQTGKIDANRTSASESLSSSTKTGTGLGRSHKEEIVESSDVSSFEDLGAVGGINTPAHTICTDKWQLVDGQQCNGVDEMASTSSLVAHDKVIGTSNTTTPNTTTNLPNSITEVQSSIPDVRIFPAGQEIQLNETFRLHSNEHRAADLKAKLEKSLKCKPSKKITRRQSDGMVFRHTASTSSTNDRPARTKYVNDRRIDDDDDDDDDDDGDDHDEEMESSNSDDASWRHSKRTSCRKCGKTKGDLKRYIARFRHQLETTTDFSEAEIIRQLNAFLEFLENHSQNSFDSKDEDTMMQYDDSLDPVVHDPHMEFDEIDVDDFDYDHGIHVYGSNADSSTNTHPPRQFFNLSSIERKEDLEELNVKQLKEVLMLNRVDFKGCCEKSELLERVQRLWDDLQNCPAVDKLATVDLCKICMDAAIECVLLECGHMATCTNCGKVLSECPICRQYIVRVVRFFKA